jgi:hypothetical protein
METPISTKTCFRFQTTSFSVRFVRKEEEEPEFVKDEDGGYLDKHGPRASSTASRLGKLELGKP